MVVGDRQLAAPWTGAGGTTCALRGGRVRGRDFINGFGANELLLLVLKYEELSRLWERKRARFEKGKGKPRMTRLNVRYT